MHPLVRTVATLACSAVFAVAGIRFYKQGRALEAPASGSPPALPILPSSNTESRQAGISALEFVAFDREFDLWRGELRLLLQRLPQGGHSAQEAQLATQAQVAAQLQDAASASSGSASLFGEPPAIGEVLVPVFESIQLAFQKQPYRIDGLEAGRWQVSIEGPQELRAIWSGRREFEWSGAAQGPIRIELRPLHGNLDASDSAQAIEATRVQPESWSTQLRSEPL